jgi:hypothetical protein
MIVAKNLQRTCREVIEKFQRRFFTGHPVVLHCTSIVQHLYMLTPLAAGLL